jgi:hypothetical protein
MSVQTANVTLHTPSGGRHGPTRHDRDPGPTANHRVSSVVPVSSTVASRSFHCVKPNTWNVIIKPDAKRPVATTYAMTAGTCTRGLATQACWGRTSPNTLRHRQRAAAAAFEQAAARYRTTVLAAVQNVADTLYALQADAESLAAAVAAERAAKRTLDITLKQQLGAANYLALLNAQQAYQQTVITRVQGQASRFADTGALFLALGGGTDRMPQRRHPPISRRSDADTIGCRPGRLVGGLHFWSMGSVAAARPCCHGGRVDYVSPG